MSKLSHSHQPSMDYIEANRMREEGFNEIEIMEAYLWANGTMKGYPSANCNAYFREGVK